MPRPQERLQRAADTADAVAQVISQTDEMLDQVRTIDGLRNRAAAARQRAASSGAIFRAFWLWRARRLDAKAERILGR